MSEFAHATLHGQYPGEQFEKSRFSRAIRADQHGALTALGMILHSAINNHVAIGMIDILKRDHAQAAAHRLREMELDRLSARDRGRDFFHAIDLFQLALCLRCFACLGAKSIGKQLQRRDFFLLIFVSGELLFFARCFLLDVTVPVAPVTHQFRVRDLDDADDKLIQNSRSCEIMTIAPG